MTSLHFSNAATATGEGGKIEDNFLQDLEEPIDLLRKLSVFQATKLKQLMTDLRCNISQFSDCLFKAVNSITFYKHRVELEPIIERIFRYCDQDNDRKIVFEDLPMTVPLTAYDPLVTENTDIIVYNDIPFLPTVNVPERPDVAQQNTIGSKIATFTKEDPFTGPCGSQMTFAMRTFVSDYLSNLDFAHCTLVQYHPAIKKHSCVYHNDLLLFEFDSSCVKVEVVAVLREQHTAPIIACIHIPHIKKLITSSADRSIVSWADSDRYKVYEMIRCVSPQTVLSYNPLSQMLVTGTTDGNICLYPLIPQLGHCVKMIKAHSEWVTGIQVVPDIDAVASCSSDGSMKLWEMETLELRMEKDSVKGKRLASLMFSSGMRSFFTTAALGREILMWSPFLPAPTEKIQSSGHDKPIVAVHCFANSPELINADQFGRVSIYDMRKTVCVQHFGSPDAAFPIGRIQSMCYNNDLSAIVVLGETLSVFLPQKGAHSAAIENPVSVICCCPISKRIFVASGSRIILFDLNTGNQIMSHSLGMQEVACMLLGHTVKDLIVGTHEGTVMCMTIGSWHISTQVVVHDLLRYVTDAGRRSALAHLSPDNPRCVAVTSSGDIWHFAHGSMCASMKHTTTELRTRLEVDLATFSPMHGYIFLVRKNAVDVWDLGTEIKKQSLAITSTHGWISAAHCVDELGTVFFVSSDATLMAYHHSTSAPIFECSFPSSFPATSLHFSSSAWVLSLRGEDGFCSMRLKPISMLLNQHVGSLEIPFMKTKPILGKRFEVDLGTADLQLRPLIFFCRKRKKRHDPRKPATLRHMIVCQSFQNTDISRERLFKRLNDFATLPFPEEEITTAHLRNLARVTEVDRPFPSEWVASHSSAPMYVVAERSSERRTDNIDLFLKISEAGRKSYRNAVPIPDAREHLRWFISCAAGAVDQLSASGFIAPLNLQYDLRRYCDTYRWLPTCGVWPLARESPKPALSDAEVESGQNSHQHSLETSMRDGLLSMDSAVHEEDDDAMEEVVMLPKHRQPPEWQGYPTVEACMWEIGLFLYHCVMGEPALNPEMKTSDINNQMAAMALSGSLYSGDFLREHMVTGIYQEAWVVDALQNLLCTPQRRWGPKKLISELRCREPPRYLACDKLPAYFDHPVSMDLDHTIAVKTGIITPIVKPKTKLRDVDVTALGLADNPFLYLAGVSNGKTSHVLACRVDGTIVGIIPPSNEARITWDVSAEEVAASNTQRQPLASTNAVAATLKSEELLAIASGKSVHKGNTLANEVSAILEGGGTTIDKIIRINQAADPMAKYCPFFTSMRGIAHSTEVEEKPYYMHGWHRNNHPNALLIARRSKSRKQEDLEKALRKRKEALETVRAENEDKRRKRQDEQQNAAIEAITGITPRSLRKQRREEALRQEQKALLDQLITGKFTPDPFLYIRSIDRSTGEYPASSPGRHLKTPSPTRSSPSRSTLGSVLPKLPSTKSK